MKPFTIEEWHDFAKKLYTLIVSEIDGCAETNLPVVYPKLVVSYQFFRLVRGEAFHEKRPHDLGELQKEIYSWEDDLARRVEKVKSKLDPKDGQTNFYIDEMKKRFEVEKT